jgi:hypothetical protein
MPETIVPPKMGHAERRARFRAYIQRFNPSAPVMEAIRDGLVREDLHGSLHTKLASRADLEPGSQQLLAGGTGSGKTTELLLTQQWLLQQPNTFPVFIDISAETDLSEIKSGTLIAAFARYAADEYKKQKRSLGTISPEGHNLEDSARHLRAFALGTWVRGYDDDPPEPETPETWIPRRLKPPLPALKREFSTIAAPLRRLLTAIFPAGNIVVLVDALDRLLTAERFWLPTESDFRAFRELGISIIVAAPLSVLFGPGKAVSEHFDRVHHLPAISTRENTRLNLILKQRDSFDMLDDGRADHLCRESGGVLRDLISLARDAAEEAYVAGQENISFDNVHAASRHLGLSYLRGLGKREITTLLELNKTSSFDLTVVENIELLVTRRVLEYSPTDFRVHPSLIGLLKE